MYSVVLMVALTQGVETPEFGRRDRGGCDGAGNNGCGGNGGGGLFGGGLFGGRRGGGHHGRNGGNGGAGCYGSSYGCYASSSYGCYGSSNGGSGCYGSSYGGGSSYGCSGSAYGGGSGGYGCSGSSYGGGSAYGCSGGYAPAVSYGANGSAYGCSASAYGQGGHVPGVSYDYSGHAPVGCQGGVIQGGETVVPPVGGETPPVRQEKVAPKGGNRTPKIGLNASEKASLVVTLPEDATLSIDGYKTSSSSARRSFVTPNLVPGQAYAYDLTAEVVRDGKTVTMKKRVTVRAGQETSVTLTPSVSMASR